VLVGEDVALRVDDGARARIALLGHRLGEPVVEELLGGDVDDALVEALVDVDVLALVGGVLGADFDLPEGGPREGEGRIRGGGRAGLGGDRNSRRVGRGASGPLQEDQRAESDGEGQGRAADAYQDEMPAIVELHVSLLA